MRKILIVVVFLALSGLVAKAQTPRIELFTGFSYGQFNPGGFLVGSSNGIGRHFSSPGLEATAQYNFNRWVGVFADVSGYGSTGDVDALVALHFRNFNYFVGPQLTARNVGPFNVFVRGLVGASYARTSVPNFDINGNQSGTLSTKSTRMAYGFGGGVDLNATKHIGLRLLQVDYLRNSFTNCSSADSPGGLCATTPAGRQNNFRVAAGFDWRF
jgi:opacity protein-like surface antigen